MEFVLDKPQTPELIGTPYSPLQAQLRGPIQTYNPSVKMPTIPSPLKDLKRALNFNADFTGCGFWRMLWPEMLINMYAKGIINGTTCMIMDPRYYESTESVRVQRQATPLQYEFVKFLRNVSNSTTDFKLIYEIDDVVFREDIPDYNSCKHAFDDPLIAETCKNIMNLCDEVTVTCDYMRQYYMDKTGHKNITVIPNYLPRFWMDRFYSSQKIADRYERHKKRPRIGYLGSGTHIDVKNATGQKDDFSHVVDVIAKTRKEFKWVFVGAVPLQLRPFIHNGDIEFHPWTTLDNYVYAFDQLDVNMVYAPLQDNTFNRSKSNIKYLESGAMGIPCVCQDLVTYSMAQLKFKTGDDLINQIKRVMGDRQLYTKQSKVARQYAESMWMEDHLDEYVKLYGIQKTT